MTACSQTVELLAAALGLLIAIAAAGPALAQKPGGVLRLSHFDSPASMSILEESTRAALQPMMGVFNNLVMYDQHVARTASQSIVPDLATSWEWSEDGKELTFPLRQGVKWHDGKPFTSGRCQMHLGPADGVRAMTSCASIPANRGTPMSPR